MADSYIIQDVNIVCTNMQVAKPLKLGHTEGARNASPNILMVSKKTLFLTEEDRKISKAFECKVPVKKWGGLAMLCAGLAIVGCIALVVCTGGAAAPALLAFAVAATKAGVIIAAAGAVVSSGIALYKEAHDCDIVQENKTPWQAVSPTVRFQKQKALLNSSYMVCQQGGTLNLIIDDVVATNAAELFSNNNRSEILWQLGSKFTIGVIVGLTGGASVPGVVLTIGFDIFFEESKSNQDRNVGEDIKEESIEFGTETALDVGTAGAEHGASAIQAWYWRNVMLYRILTNAGDDAVNSAATMCGMASNAPGHIWKDLGKGLGAGLGGAIVGFGVDQFSNTQEEELEKNVRKKSEAFDTQDAKNHIGVLAIIK